MQFLGIPNDLFFALLGGIGGALVLLYLIRLRSRRIAVPYGPIWQAVLAEATVRSLWHRIKRWLSLLLQLVILLLLLFALRDPRPADEATEGRHLLLLVDTSASMATRDMPGGRDRMEAAREAALRAFDELGPQDQVMLARLDGQVRPLTPFVRPTAPVRALIGELDYTATAADVPGALRFAARSLADRPRASLLFVSDAAWGDVDPAALPDLGDTDARLVSVGAASGNLAILAFNVRRYASDRRNFEVFVELGSTFEVPVTAELSLEANGRLVQQQLIELAPAGEAGARATRIFGDLPAGGEQLTATARIVGGDANDAFALDDTAYALLPQDRATRVLLVSEGNLFVEAPLLLDQNIELTRLTPAAYDRSLADGRPAWRDADVTVFDDHTPPPGEGQRALYLHPSGDASPWDVRGQLSDPIIDRFDRGDPLNRWIHGYRSVNIEVAQRLRLGDDDHAVATAIGDDPMIVRRETADARLAAVAFRIEDSDLGLRVIYPLLMLNIVDWLSGDSGGLVPSYRTGVAARVRLPAELRSAALDDGAGAEVGRRIVAPGGEAEEAREADGYLTFLPLRPGYHRLEDAGATELVFAANLFDAAESDIAPLPAAALPIPAEGWERATETAEASVFAHRHPWFYLVLAAAALLFVEWVTYNRRVTV